MSKQKKIFQVNIMLIWYGMVWYLFGRSLSPGHALANGCNRPPTPTGNPFTFPQCLIQPVSVGIAIPQLI